MSKKNPRKNGYRKDIEKEGKRTMLDLLMQMNLNPVPLKGGWISFECPVCSRESAILNTTVVESYCSSCREIRSVPGLMVAVEKKRGVF